MGRFKKIIKQLRRHWKGLGFIVLLGIIADLLQILESRNQFLAKKDERIAELERKLTARNVSEIQKDETIRTIVNRLIARLVAIEYNLFKLGQAEPAFEHDYFALCTELKKNQDISKEILSALVNFQTTGTTTTPTDTLRSQLNIRQGIEEGRIRTHVGALRGSTTSMEVDLDKLSKKYPAIVGQFPAIQDSLRACLQLLIDIESTLEANNREIISQKLGLEQNSAPNGFSEPTTPATGAGPITPAMIAFSKEEATLLNPANQIKSYGQSYRRDFFVHRRSMLPPAQESRHDTLISLLQVQTSNPIVYTAIRVGVESGEWDQKKAVIVLPANFTMAALDDSALAKIERQIFAIEDSIKVLNNNEQILLRSIEQRIKKRELLEKDLKKSLKKALLASFENNGL